MRLLEYQAKELFKEYGIRVPTSIVSKDVESGRKDAEKIGYPFVIKAQVPVGGRGKAGGIQKCHNEDEFELKYPQVLNMTIKGEKTRAVLLEKMSEYEKEIYLSLFLNRSKRCYTIISSAEGGVEIESVKNQVIREIGLGDVTKKVAEDVAKEIGSVQSATGTDRGRGMVPFVPFLAHVADLRRVYHLRRHHRHDLSPLRALRHRPGIFRYAGRHRLRSHDGPERVGRIRRRIPR